jgi:hypothetical protein
VALAVHVLEHQGGLARLDRRRASVRAHEVRTRREGRLDVARHEAREHARERGADPLRLEHHEPQVPEQAEQRAREGAREALARARQEQLERLGLRRTFPQVLAQQLGQRAEPVALLVEHDAREQRAARGHPRQRDLAQIEVRVLDPEVVHLGHVVVVGVVPEERHDRRFPALREGAREDHDVQRLVEVVQRAAQQRRLLPGDDHEHAGRAQRAHRLEHGHVRLEARQLLLERRGQLLARLGVVALARTRERLHVARELDPAEVRRARTLGQRARAPLGQAEHVGGQVLELERHAQRLASAAPSSAIMDSRGRARGVLPGAAGVPLLAPGEGHAARRVDERAAPRPAFVAEGRAHVGGRGALRAVARQEQRRARHARAQPRELVGVRRAHDRADRRPARGADELGAERATASATRSHRRGSPWPWNSALFSFEVRTST